MVLAAQTTISSDAMFFPAKARGIARRKPGRAVLADGTSAPVKLLGGVHKIVKNTIHRRDPHSQHLVLYPADTHQLCF
jgi:hypothetical protein